MKFEEEGFLALAVLMLVFLVLPPLAPLDALAGLIAILCLYGYSKAMGMKNREANKTLAEAKRIRDENEE